MSTRSEIQKHLFELKDDTYAEFQRKLIPNLMPEAIIGVRTPVLRAYAKELYKRHLAAEFLSELPHTYLDENQLHSFLISLEKDYDICVKNVDLFLPYVNNWATCDQLSPKVFPRHKDELLLKVRAWMLSEHTYTIRFGIGMLMQHYLDDAFKKEYPALVADISSGEYYVNMMRAWYFATALAKQYDATLPYIEKQCLDVWTHNKSIQKAVESHRISPQQKEYLKSLKIKEAK